MLKAQLEEGEEYTMEEFLTLVEAGMVEISDDEYEALLGIVEFQKLSPEEQAEYFEEQGRYYGYPTCCIEDFLERVKQDKEPTEDQSKAGEGTGFIPCKHHTNQILSGEITLESLIQNRECETPFPIDDFDVEDEMS